MRNPFNKILILIFILIEDLEQGRNICKALWDFYKISGHIEGCKVNIEDDIEAEREEPVVQVRSEGSEVESSFQFPANFPVNPNYKSSREIDDQGGQ